jgi:hypothetical protein
MNAFDRVGWKKHPAAFAERLEEGDLVGGFVTLNRGFREAGGLGQLAST